MDQGQCLGFLCGDFGLGSWNEQLKEETDEDR
jgi:hypothetical protein